MAHLNTLMKQLTDRGVSELRVLVTDAGVVTIARFDAETVSSEAKTTAEEGVTDIVPKIDARKAQLANVVSKRDQEAKRLADLKAAQDAEQAARLAAAKGGAPTP